MATRRPQRPINEQGRLITEEEKADREWQRKQDRADIAVLTIFAIVVYPFVMIARGAKKVWNML